VLGAPGGRTSSSPKHANYPHHKKSRICVSWARSTSQTLLTDPPVFDRIFLLATRAELRLFLDVIYGRKTARSLESVLAAAASC
jgi:hypothetical protein